MSSVARGARFFLGTKRPNNSRCFSLWRSLLSCRRASLSLAGMCGRFERLDVAHTCMEGTAFIPEVRHVDTRQQSTAYMRHQQCERSGAQCSPQQLLPLLCSRTDDLPSNHCIPAPWQAAGLQQQGSSSESAPWTAVRAAPISASRP